MAKPGCLVEIPTLEADLALGDVEEATSTQRERPALGGHLGELALPSAASKPLQEGPSPSSTRFSIRVKLSGWARKKESQSSNIACRPMVGLPKATWKFVASPWYNFAAAGASRRLYVATQSRATSHGVFMTQGPLFVRHALEPEERAESLSKDPAR